MYVILFTWFEIHILVTYDHFSPTICLRNTNKEMMNLID
jgi:hypothetical protein